MFWPLAQWMRAQDAPKFIVLVLFALLVPQAVAAALQSQTGVVTRVIDGDTVWVKTSASQPPLKVRLQGIDAPEICQPGGVQARDALQSQVLGQRVTLTSRAHDGYGRTIAMLHLQSQDMSRWMVAQGHAWANSHRHGQGIYAAELRQAKSARRGVFSNTSAEDPRLFRKRHGSCWVKR